jgi:hypothetical protein
MRNFKTPLFSKRRCILLILAVSLLVNVALTWAYIHYVVQINNVYTIGAEYKIIVKISDLNAQERLAQFNIQKGQMLGENFTTSLYWGEMIGSSKWSPIISIVNTSSDKSENITWQVINLPSSAVLGSFYADANGSTGIQWLQGASGAKALSIGASFDVVFSLMCENEMPDGVYSFGIRIQCED